jgi:uncharacterized alkaline shock family protein YloU
MKSTTSTQKINDTKNPTTVLEKAELGEVKIHENVVAQLVRRAVLGVEGVSRLAGSTLVDDIATLVGSRRMQSRAVSVILGDEGRVEIEVKLILKFGYHIPETAEQVQTAIVELVESTTGMSVTKVDVLIHEIEDEETEVNGDAEDADAAIAPAMPLN